MSPWVTRRRLLVGLGVVAVGAGGVVQAVSSGDSNGYTPGTVLIENQGETDKMVSVAVFKKREDDRSAEVFRERATIGVGSQEIYEEAYTEPGIYRVTARTENGGTDEHSRILFWEDRNGEVTGFSTRVRIRDDGSLNIAGTVNSGVRIPPHIQDKTIRPDD